MSLEQTKPLAQELERPPALDRIVSDRLSAAKKKKFRDVLFDTFISQEFTDILGKEVSHLPDQDDLIREADRLTNGILLKLGINPKTNLEPKHVHILNEKDFLKLDEEGSEEQTQAVASSAFQGIFIKNQEMTALEFLNRVVHEMLHLKSFISFQLSDNIEEDQITPGIAAIPRRFGLKVPRWSKVASKKQSDKEKKTLKVKKVLFNGLDEAIIERLTLDIIRNGSYNLPGELKKRFENSEKLRNILVDYVNNSYKNIKDQRSSAKSEELESLLVFFEWGVMFLPEADDFLKMYTDSGNSSLVLEQAISFYSRSGVLDTLPMFSYIDQRIKMEKLIAEIFNRNMHKFKSPMDVFKIFTRAAFEGRLLPLARLIDETFGKGSFRKLGEGEDITAVDFSE